MVRGCPTKPWSGPTRRGAALASLRTLMANVGHQRGDFGVSLTPEMMLLHCICTCIYNNAHEYLG